ncbi:FISUMP domain-containing protein [Bacteroidota bacterium]
MYEDKKYNTVQIGDQCWLKENLDVGEMIDGVQNMTSNGEVEKYCWGDIPSNCVKYGGLYQWDEVMQYSTESVQGICPDGWHIPAKAEYQSLIFAVDGNINDLKEIGQGTGVGVGTNVSGFSVLLVGNRNDDTRFIGEGKYAHFWTSSEVNSIYAHRLLLRYDTASYDLSRSTVYKTHGFQVRCIKD